MEELKAKTERTARITTKQKQQNCKYNEKYFLIYFLKLITKEFKVGLSPFFNCFIYFNVGPLK